ncbi:MAG: signal peptidase II [Gammaproteobacteria bacterium]|nr:signal peptidase II [Gammaproteobacteria bacterium]
MIRWYSLAAGVLALDQATKWIALGQLERGMSVDVFPFLSWTLTCNTGAAFSMFQGHSWVFAVAAVAVSAFLIFEIWRLRSGWLEGASYGLVLAGALGNLTDRLIHECVVDFIHVYYGWFNFPVFNVADSAITVGAAGWIGLLAVDMLRRRAGRSQSE